MGILVARMAGAQAGGLKQQKQLSFTVLEARSPSLSLAALQCVLVTPTGETASVPSAGVRGQRVRPRGAAQPHSCL